MIFRTGIFRFLPGFTFQNSPSFLAQTLFGRGTPIKTRRRAFPVYDFTASAAFHPNFVRKYFYFGSALVTNKNLRGKFAGILSRACGIHGAFLKVTQ
jgi:hypothetical protein